MSRQQSTGPNNGSITPAPASQRTHKMDDKRLANKKLSYNLGHVRESADEGSRDVLMATKKSGIKGPDSIIQTQQSDKDLQFYPMQSERSRLNVN